MELAASFLRYFRSANPSGGPLISEDAANTRVQSPWRPDPHSILEIRRTLERILLQNILPFWYPGVIDWNEGGYRLNHDVNGRWSGRANKGVVTQARTVWFFSRLVNSSFGRPEYLAAASHGYEFLQDRMWDKEFGGFYWEVDPAGHTATISEKRMYGQAFALYALTEYATAAGDEFAQARAKELFTLMEHSAHDKAHGGYQDICRRDWTPISRLKRMNTHMHLLEAMTTFSLLTNDPVVRERLGELILINSNSVLRKNIGACTERHLENWIPDRGPDHDRVSYGHDVENIWLLVQACMTVGIPYSLLSDLYKTVFNYALQHGYDHRNGGFYASGPLNRAADRREKVWWVQAEGLIAALQMYRFTEEKTYWTCFSRTLEWIVNHQADWEYGDWHETITEEAKIAGVKAGLWKSPYHNGRAMLECLELLAGNRS